MWDRIEAGAILETVKERRYPMKKIVTMILVVLLTATFAFAAGGKNHGDVGQGSVDQGDTGNKDASPGSDAMGNQVD